LGRCEQPGASAAASSECRSVPLGWTVAGRVTCLFEHVLRFETDAPGLFHRGQPRALPANSDNRPRHPEDLRVGALTTGSDAWIGERLSRHRTVRSPRDLGCHGGKSAKSASTSQPSARQGCSTIQLFLCSVTSDVTIVKYALRVDVSKTRSKDEHDATEGAWQSSRADAGTGGGLGGTGFR
jgi:hypothetical protein